MEKYKERSFKKILSIHTEHEQGFVWQIFFKKLSMPDYKAHVVGSFDSTLL